MINFNVYGLPGPQGSKSFKGRSKKTGKAIMVESSAKVKPWREAVKWAARQAMEESVRDAIIQCVNHGLTFPPALPLDGPLVARMVFTLPKPKGAPKLRKTYADRKPDLSKLARSTEDALTDAGLIADDARIVEFSRLAKVFPNEDPESLSCPGVRITITPQEALTVMGYKA